MIALHGQDVVAAFLLNDGVGDVANGVEGVRGDGGSFQGGGFPEQATGSCQLALLFICIRLAQDLGRSLADQALVFVFHQAGR